MTLKVLEEVKQQEEILEGLFSIPSQLLLQVYQDWSAHSNLKLCYVQQHSSLSLPKDVQLPVSLTSGVRHLESWLQEIHSVKQRVDQQRPVRIKHLFLPL
eukprot:Lithocolla_globosa_v1_NODE_1315_length_2677_cov_13.200229.p4 type:complete len:100 gc:universal NODE_1315_length_2677_cov_13.200229:2118-1819(-)